MKVRVLGCSGGIGGRHQRTTSLIVDHDLLIDVGTGAGELSVDELVAIDHVFLTHAHLDHIACLPMLIDTVGDLRDKPLVIHALPKTLATLKKHIFNWDVWPDFSAVPSKDAPFMCYQPIRVGDVLSFGSRRLTVLPAEHTVPAVGYHLDSGRASLVFTGDTGPNPALWPIVNAIDNLRMLIIETAFPDRDRTLAEVSKHHCPLTLAAELTQLRRDVELYITHLKPGQIEMTLKEIEERVAQYRPQMLQNNQVFNLPD